MTHPLTDIPGEFLIALKLLAAMVLGGLLGYDRERHGADAGLRTYAAVCMGATLFTAVGEHLVDGTASGRVIASIIQGIGFLCAGIIFRNATTGESVGLTTAATVWATAAIGVAVGLDMYVIAVVGTLMLYWLISLHHRKWYMAWKERLKESEKLKPDGHRER